MKVFDRTKLTRTVGFVRSKNLSSTTATKINKFKSVKFSAIPKKSAKPKNSKQPSNDDKNVISAEVTETIVDDAKAGRHPACESREPVQDAVVEERSGSEGRSDACEDDGDDERSPLAEADAVLPSDVSTHSASSIKKSPSDAYIKTETDPDDNLEADIKTEAEPAPFKKSSSSKKVSSDLEARLKSLKTSCDAKGFDLIVTNHISSTSTKDLKLAETPKSKSEAASKDDIDAASDVIKQQTKAPVEEDSQPSLVFGAMNYIASFAGLGCFDPNLDDTINVDTPFVSSSDVAKMDSQPLGGPKYYIIANNKAGKTKICHEAFARATEAIPEEKGYEVIEYTLVPRDGEATKSSISNVVNVLTGGDIFDDESRASLDGAISPWGLSDGTHNMLLSLGGCVYNAIGLPSDHNKRRLFCNALLDADEYFCICVDFANGRF